MGYGRGDSATLTLAAGQPLVLAASGSVGTLAGNPNDIKLVPAASNPDGLLIWSLSISSAVATPGLASGFIVEDTITDSNSVQYLANEISLPATGSVPMVDSNSVSQDMRGIEVAAGADLFLNNGGAAGTTAFHRCSGTVIYTPLA